MHHNENPIMLGLSWILVGAAFGFFVLVKMGALGDKSDQAFKSIASESWDINEIGE